METQNVDQLIKTLKKNFKGTENHKDEFVRICKAWLAANKGTKNTVRWDATVEFLNSINIFV